MLVVTINKPVYAHVWSCGWQAPYALHANHILIIVTTSILPSYGSCMPSPLVYGPLVTPHIHESYRVICAHYIAQPGSAWKHTSQ